MRVVAASCPKPLKSPTIPAPSDCSRQTYIQTVKHHIFHNFCMITSCTYHDLLIARQCILFTCPKALWRRLIIDDLLYKSNFVYTTHKYNTTLYTHIYTIKVC